jgi:hypothetical protein
VPSVITPATNETTSPFQFDGPVNFGAVSATAQLTATAFNPASVGLQAWTFPTCFATGVGSAVTTAGRLYLATLNLAAGIQLTKLYFNIATAASGITSSQNFAGLFNATGTQVATTADLSTLIGTNTGYITAPLTATYTVPTAGVYYFGVFFNAGTTQPVLTTQVSEVTVTTSSTVAAGPVATAAQYPFSVSATTGLTTALPASITVSSNSLTGAYNLWAAAS